MKYAIIAAGEGSRLAQEGVEIPKPLVSIAGEAMIDRLIRIFMANRASSIHIVINEQMSELHQHLEQLELAVPLYVTVATTPSSMHSFYALMPQLEGESFCLTTVDTIFNEREFATYINTFEQNKNCDALMAVTSYIDDEKPLYVATNKQMQVTHFLDNNTEQLANYISGGIYCLTPAALPVLEQAITDGEARMRNYQRRLLQAGLQVEAYPFSQIIDVDHQSDITKAAQCIANYQA